MLLCRSAGRFGRAPSNAASEIRALMQEALDQRLPFAEEVKEPPRLTTALLKTALGAFVGLGWVLLTSYAVYVVLTKRPLYAPCKGVAVQGLRDIWKLLVAGWVDPASPQTASIKFLERPCCSMAMLLCALEFLQ